MNIEETHWKIWSIEHNMWWKPQSLGYTPDKTSAGVYKYTEALAIVEGANKYQSVDSPPNEAMILDKRSS